MPTAYNKDTGELLTLSPDGQWTAPKMAQNPETGEKVFLDGNAWKPVPSQALGTPEQNKIRSAFDGPLSKATDVLRQGATLGFSDELGAALSTPVPFLKNLPQGLSAASEAAGKRYDDVLAYERAKLKEFKQESPIASAALETAGGLVLGPSVTKAGSAIAPLKPPPAAGMPSLPMTMAKTAGGAATIGSIAGFGGGEGGLGNRLEDAATTGAISGLIGGATPVALKAAGGAGDLIRNLIGSGNADEQAMQMALRALERDKIDPGAIRPTGKPEAIVDLGGENVRGLMRGAASLPGPARRMTQDFVATRQAGQGARIADDVANAISPNTNYAGTIDDLILLQSTKASPLYKEAYAANQAIDSPLLRKIEQTPAGKAAFAKARNMMLNDMQRLGATDKELTELAREAGLESGEAVGRGGVASGLKLEFWDYVKRALDDDIGAAVMSGSKNQSRILSGLKNALTKELDNLDVTAAAGPNSLKPEGGAYARARAAYAGPSRSMEALELGRTILKEDSDLTAKAVKELTEGDREFFKAGVVRAIKDAADNTQDGADITKRFFGKPALREKLQAAFDDPASFRAFEEAITKEAQMYKNAAAINPRAGSPTAIIQEEQRDIRKNPVVQFVTDAFRQGPFQAVGNAAGNLYDRGRGINPSTSEALAKLLLEANPRPLEQISGQLAGQKAKDIQRAQEIARQLGLVGRAEGALISSF